MTDGPRDEVQQLAAKAREAAEDHKTRVERTKPIRGEVTTGAELYHAEIPEPPAVVEGVIAGGSISIIAGQHKVGKTILGLQLAMAIPAGLDWLGFTTHPTGVLYLNYEVAEWSFQRRYRRMVRALAAPKHKGDEAARLRAQRISRDFHQVTLPRWRINKAPDLRAIADVCLDRKIGLVIIDPIRAAYPGARNDDREVGAVMTGLLEHVVQPSGAAVVLLHHMRKPPSGETQGGSSWEVKGSGEWTDGSDSILTVRKDTKDQSGKGRLVNMTLRHWESIDDLRIELHPASLTFTRAGLVETADVARLRAAFIMASQDRLNQGGTLTMEQIGEALGCSRQWAAKRITRGDFPQVEEVERRGSSQVAMYAWKDDTPELPAPWTD